MFKIDRSKTSIILRIPLIFAIFILILTGVYYYFHRQGYRIEFSVIRKQYVTYQNESPRFSFSYPSNRFVLDKDEENHFGEDYLIGIKLPSDHRVGCDVRAIEGSLSLDGELGIISSNLAKQISKGAKFFQSEGGSFTEVGGEKAVKLEITFSGPLGEIMRTDQIFTSHGNLVYTLICGSTQDTFEFFVTDFAHFFETFAWK